MAGPSHDQPFNALVTGGAGGIGAATARKLASRGMNVLIADVSEEGVRVAEQIKEEYKVDVFYQHVDVRREEDISAMIKAIVERWGRLDYAANVAGICLDGAELLTDEMKVSTELFDRFVLSFSTRNPESDFALQDIRDQPARHLAMPTSRSPANGLTRASSSAILPDSSKRDPSTARLHRERRLDSRLDRTRLPSIHPNQSRRRGHDPERSLLLRQT